MTLFAWVFTTIATLTSVQSVEYATKALCETARTAALPGAAGKTVGPCYDNTGYKLTSPK